MTLLRRSRLAFCSIMLAGCVARPLAIPEEMPPIKPIEPTCGPSAAPVAMPERLSGLAAVTLGGEIFVLGGTSAGPGSSRFLSYTTKTGSWHAPPPLPFPLLGNAHAATDGQRIYITDLGQAAVFEVTTGAWAQLPPPPDARFDQALAVDADGRLYCFGGERDGPFEDEAAMKQFFVYDPATSQWSTRHDAPVLGAGLMAITLPSGAIYVGSSSAALYDPAADAWSTHPAEDRSWSQGAVDASGVLFAAGGTYPYGSVVDGLDRYDAIEGTWRSISRLPIAAKGAGVALGCDGRVYVIGGSNGERLDAVQVFDPPSATWQVSQ